LEILVGERERERERERETDRVVAGGVVVARLTAQQLCLYCKILWRSWIRYLISC
jgi:hypothetical protein